MAEACRAPEGYPIGTVSMLTGLDVHTIRAWERRHGAVAPSRTGGGTRRYRDADVTRLQLMKALTDCGEPIRLVAGLDDEELRARLQRLAGLAAGPGPDTRQGVRIGLLEPRLSHQLRAGAGDTELRRGHDGLPLLRVDVDAEALPELLEGAARHEVDVLLVGLPLLGDDPLAGFDACRRAGGGRPVFVLYTFASRGLLERLSRRGARLVRAPIRLDALRRLLRDAEVITRARRKHLAEAEAVVVRTTGSAPERLLDDEHLARLAETVSNVECECPNHLSSIVSGLVAFEEYSKSCESLDAADATLHAELARVSGHARALVERLLLRVCEHDGIVV